MSARWLPGNRQTRLVFFDVTVVYLVDHRAASYLVLCSFRDNNMIWLYKTWIATLDAIIKRIILGRCLRGGKMKTISKAQTTGSHYCECDRLERFNLSRTWPENRRQRPAILFFVCGRVFRWVDRLHFTWLGRLDRVKRKRVWPRIIHTCIQGRWNQDAGAHDGPIYILSF